MHWTVKATVTYGERRVHTKQFTVEHSRYSVEELTRLRQDAIDEYCELAGIQLPGDRMMVKATLDVKEVR